MVIFLYNLYIFVWIQYGCKTNIVYALDHNNSVIKRLWCIMQKGLYRIAPWLQIRCLIQQKSADIFLITPQKRMFWVPLEASHMTRCYILLE